MAAHEFNHGTSLSEGEIRLFTIGSAKGDDMIAIELDTYNLRKQEDTYEAISYAWCSTELTHRIICNGKPFSITASLHSALWQFREDDDHGLLWADAICIHQDNLEEKTHQVREMTEIFHRAGQVLIWLGPDDGFASTALDVIRMIDDESSGLQDNRPGMPYQHGFELFGRAGIPKLNSPDWRALGKLLSCEWFGRTWILREIMAAKGFEMRIGFTSIEPQIVFSSMIKILNSGLIMYALTKEEAQSIKDHATALHLYAMQTLEVFDQGKWTLAYWLYMSRHFSCRDARDRFFAVLGPMLPGAPQLINYEFPLVKVVIETAMYAVTSRTSPQDRCQALFEMLTVIDGRELVPGIPSWCPTYVYHQRFEPLNARYLRDIPVEGSEQEIKVDCNNHLLLQGWKIDSLAMCVEIPDILKDRSVHQNLLDAQLFADFSICYLDFADACELLLQKMYDDDNDDDGMAEQKSMLAQCMSLGYREADESEIEARQASIRSWEAMKLSSKLDYSFHKHRNIKGKPEFYETVLEDCAVYPRGTIKANEQINPVSVMDELVKRCSIEQNRIVHPAGLAMSGRKFCSTSNRRIGWAPDVAVEGDVICLFEGWPRPFALRPVRDAAKPSYTLLGACYIHGLDYDVATAKAEFQSFEIV